MSRRRRSSPSAPHVLWPWSISLRFTSRSGSGAPSAAAADAAAGAGGCSSSLSSAAAPSTRGPAPSAASIDAAITGLKVEPRRPASRSVAKLSTLPIISSSHTFSTASRNLGATPARSASQERSGGAAEQKTAAREVEGGERSAGNSN